MMSVIDRVSLADQIAEVKREIEMRKRTYLRMVEQGKMTTVEAERRTLVMCGVLDTLERVRDEKAMKWGGETNHGGSNDDADAGRKQEDI